EAGALRSRSCFHAQDASTTYLFGSTIPRWLNPLLATARIRLTCPEIAWRATFKSRQTFTTLLPAQRFWSAQCRRRTPARYTRQQRRTFHLERFLSAPPRASNPRRTNA